jgi:hypothetical protein
MRQIAAEGEPVTEEVKKKMAELDRQIAAGWETCRRLEERQRQFEARLQAEQQELAQTNRQIADDLGKLLGLIRAGHSEIAAKALERILRKLTPGGN